jgi:hypothetical protein
MIQILINEINNKRKYQILLFSSIVFFFLLYVFLDLEQSNAYTNAYYINYSGLLSEFSGTTTFIHIMINVVIAVLSGIMVTLAILNQALTNIDPKGSNAVPMLTFIFGLLTFGCTGCVVAFFTAIGIAFTPIILPNANLLWKLMALLFVVLGYIYVIHSIKNIKCDLKRG